MDGRMTEEQKDRLDFIASLLELMAKHDVTDLEDREKDIRITRPIIQKLPQIQMGPVDWSPAHQDGVPTQPPEAEDDRQKVWGDRLQYSDG